VSNKFMGKAVECGMECATKAWMMNQLSAEKMRKKSVMGRSFHPIQQKDFSTFIFINLF
jgi:hypothetical protein